MKDFVGIGGRGISTLAEGSSLVSNSLLRMKPASKPGRLRREYRECQNLSLKLKDSLLSCVETHREASLVLFCSRVALHMQDLDQ
jgi:hypothetical protein